MVAFLQNNQVTTSKNCFSVLWFSDVVLFFWTAQNLSIYHIFEYFKLPLALAISFAACMYFLLHKWESQSQISPPDWQTNMVGSNQSCLFSSSLRRWELSKENCFLRQEMRGNILDSDVLICKTQLDTCSHILKNLWIK